MIVTFIPRRLDVVKRYISDLPRGTKIHFMRACVNYIIGDTRHGLKHEPPNKFVTRARAYGQVSQENPPAPAGYFSWDQFRYVAAITEGFTLFYSRTYTLASKWEMNPQESDWRRVKIFNEADGAAWVFGDKTQARQPALVGWRRVSDTVAANLVGALRAGMAAVKAKLKLK